MSKNFFFAALLIINSLLYFNSIGYALSYSFYRWSDESECIKHEVRCNAKNKFDTIGSLLVSENNCGDLQSDEVCLDLSSKCKTEDPAIMISSSFICEKDLEAKICKKKDKKNINQKRYSTASILTPPEQTDKSHQRPKKNRSSWNFAGLLGDILESVFEAFLLGD